MFPAACVGDNHVCPMVTPAVPPMPHVGGPILPPGAVNVLGWRQARGQLGVHVCLHRAARFDREGLGDRSLRWKARCTPAR
jgi:hypothetical protein